MALRTPDRSLSVPLGGRKLADNVPYPTTHRSRFSQRDGLLNRTKRVVVSAATTPIIWVGGPVSGGDIQRNEITV